MKKNQFSKIILILFLQLMGTSSLWAALGFEDAVFPELAASGRALALGGAYISKVDDSAAAFYNPAGLGTVRKLKFHLSNIHSETNMGWLKLATGGKITEAITSLPAALTMEGIRQRLVSKPGNLTNTRYQLVPNITGRFFSIGYLFSRKTRMRLKSSSDDLEYADRYDYGPYGSMNLSLFGGIIKGGMTMILLSRHQAEKSDANRNVPLNLQDSDYKIGSGLFTIGGGKLTLPISWLPCFSATIHNAFNKDFTSFRGGGKPTKIKSSIDAGFSVTPKIGKRTRMHLEINYKDVTKQYTDVHLLRKALIGVELDFSRAFFLRFGYGDSYGTAGLGFKSKTIDFDLSTYSVNPDPTSGAIRGDEDRRISLSISTGFGF